MQLLTGAAALMPSLLVATDKSYAENYRTPPDHARSMPGCAAQDWTMMPQQNEEVREVTGRALAQGQTCGGYHWKPRPGLVYKRLLVGAHPQRGSLRLREPGQYYYTAPKNYLGPDRFTLRICGSKDGIPGCVNLVYSMTIVARTPIR